MSSGFLINNEINLNCRLGKFIFFEVVRFTVIETVHFPQGKILLHNVAAGIIISNQSLVQQGVSRSTAGNYTCVGYNTEGDGESNAFYLNVMCK